MHGVAIFYEWFGNVLYVEMRKRKERKWTNLNQIIPNVIFRFGLWNFDQTTLSKQTQQMWGAKGFPVVRLFWNFLFRQVLICPNKLKRSKKWVVSPVWTICRIASKSCLCRLGPAFRKNQIEMLWLVMINSKLTKKYLFVMIWSGSATVIEIWPNHETMS